MPMKNIVLATNNPHKVVEIKAILGKRFVITTLAEEGISVDIEETGTTFAQNAYIKAHAIARLTNKAALSDDSGLVVDALDGAPGVYSARYAGAQQDDAANIAKLLANMQGVSNRRARFVCAVALCQPDGSAITAEGVAEGEILYEQVGSGGFGYDPVFFSVEISKTFAQASASEKNLISHRKRALESLAAQL